MKICMPPAAGTEMSFEDVIKQEYEYLLRSSALARECQHSWKKMPLYVSTSDSRAMYREKPCEVRPQVHIGQLKLFLSELQFLTEFTTHGVKSVIVYAGAADGHHIAYLAQLFPYLEFHLYDPRPFSPILSGIENIEFMTGSLGWFNEAMASGYGFSGCGTREYDVLFISDIRSGSSENANCDFDACCIRDMDAQLSWMQLMKPKAGMFKFRLSYNPGKTTWLAPCDEKHLMYGIFAAKSATEMRLISTDYSSLWEYDNTGMEERAYYFNNFTRMCQYGMSIPGYRENSIKKILGMDDCWDCCAMREICLEFLSKKYEQEFGPTKEVVEVISAAVAYVINVPSSLAEIIARCVTFVDEQELYGFITAVIKNCGSNASYKMHKSPHGEPAQGRQWVDRMGAFRGIPLSIKKNRPRLTAPVVAKIGKLYSQIGEIAPPLGKYPDF